MEIDRVAKEREGLRLRGARDGFCLGSIQVAPSKAFHGAVWLGLLGDDTGRCSAVKTQANAAWRHYTSSRYRSMGLATRVDGVVRSPVSLHGALGNDLCVAYQF